MRNSLLVVCVASACLHVVPAFAQSGGPDPATVRVRLGPLMMNPTIAISNIGIDHNVFNEPASKNPKEDFTVTVTPTTDFWLRAGPSWITAGMNEQINWYQKYASERSANNQYRLGWSLPGSVMLVNVGWSYINAKERPGFEIDARVGHKDVTYTGSLDYRALSKTFIGVSVNRAQTKFAAEAEFQGVNLQDSLNRTNTVYGINLRHDLTPLTSITFSGSRTLDQFAFSTDRDTVATTATTAISFQPGALFKGGVSIGYTDFKPTDPSLPAYKGAVGKVDLTYVLLGSTRFALTGSRGVQYSYDNAQPYYVESGINASIAQQIFGPFDVAVHGGIDVMAYRDRTGAVIQVADRSDHTVSYGIGIGFHMGKDLRLSLNLDKVNRDSQLADRTYDNYRLGTALTYGFLNLGS